MKLAIQTGLTGLAPVVRPPPWTMTSAGSAAEAKGVRSKRVSAKIRSRCALFLTGLVHLYDFGNFRVILEDDRTRFGMPGLADQCHVRQLQDHCGFCFGE